MVVEGTIKFLRFTENDILAHFNFGINVMPRRKTIKEIWCKFVTLFSSFSIKLYLELPHRGDSNGMP